MTSAIWAQLREILAGRQEAIANSWYRAVAPTGFPSLGPADIRQRLGSLTQQALKVLLSAPFRPDQAQAIGAGLASLHLVQPETLRRTLRVLARELVAGISPVQVRAVRPNLDALLSDVAAGFFERARTMILEEQEETRAALFAARQEAEAAFRASEELLWTTIGNAPIILFALDRTGTFTLCAGKALAELGRAPGEIVGRSIRDVYPDDPAFAENVHRALAGARFTATADVDDRAFETWYGPLVDQLGAIVGVIGVATDITARKRAEAEQLALEQLKADFVANVSHDLRTPVHHIKGYTALLRSHGAALDEETRQEFLETISNASDQLARLITDLIEASQLTGGDLRLHVGPLQIDQLVRSVVQRWQGISSHQIAVLTPPDTPPVQADLGRIEQVLDNLLTNVVRHTPEQTCAEVRVEVAGEELVVTVVDDGPGVGAEDLPRVFDRFYQVEPSIGGQRNGSGLGLFICRRIIEQHGGRIWAEPTPGTGITVRFTLPRQSDAGAGRGVQREGADGAQTQEE